MAFIGFHCSTCVNVGKLLIFFLLMLFDWLQGKRMEMTMSRLGESRDFNGYLESPAVTDFYISLKLLFGLNLLLCFLSFCKLCSFGSLFNITVSEVFDTLKALQAHEHTACKIGVQLQ